MKKPIRTGQPALKLNREHIRLLTSIELRQAVGGEPATGSGPKPPVSTKDDGGCH